MTEIRLYNTRTRTKDTFAPIDPANVRMYVCGPTVYDRAHIGNARPVVVFDVLFRLLRHVYGENAVTYVRNFTDIDDKINARAAETRGAGESTLDAIARITAETTAWYHEDMDALGALRPTHEPRATGHIPEMIAMTEALIAKGHAYAAEGHVLFDVPSWKAAYGALSRRSTDELLAGARVDVAPFKRSAMDFVLWKPSDDETPGWESPWARGRPGWHIECSAMSKALLGETFDIHGGGIDLVFPHHENELAQSCCANGTERMANVWMHNGYLMVEGEKMSKSLGNFFTVKDLRDEGLKPEVMRLMMLKTHYRQPLDWTSRSYDEAREELVRWSVQSSGASSNATVPTELIDALSDDLNTPGALTVVRDIAKSDEPTRLRSALEFLGVDLLRVQRGSATLSGTGRLEASGTLVKFEDRVVRLLQARAEAREARNFQLADEIRDALANANVVVRDTPEGAEWEKGPDFDMSKFTEAEALL